MAASKLPATTKITKIATAHLRLSQSVQASDTSCLQAQSRWKEKSRCKCFGRQSFLSSAIIGILFLPKNCTNCLTKSVASSTSSFLAWLWNAVDRHYLPFPSSSWLASMKLLLVKLARSSFPPGKIGGCREYRQIDHANEKLSETEAMAFDLTLFEDTVESHFFIFFELNRRAVFSDLAMKMTVSGWGSGDLVRVCSALLAAEEFLQEFPVQENYTLKWIEMVKKVNSC